MSEKIEEGVVVTKGDMFTLVAIVMTNVEAQRLYDLLNLVTDLSWENFFSNVDALGIREHRGESSAVAVLQDDADFISGFNYQIWDAMYDAGFKQSPRKDGKKTEEEESW